MRILIACSSCKTQYDVSGHNAGDGVHCRCGTVMVVPEPRVHDAKVVRCSSCGASRGDGGSDCTFCGARFSIADKGWGSMCPGCFCRLPLDAKHCVECGLRINPRSIDKKETKLPCPRCKCKLQERVVNESLTLHECNGCGGIWLGVETFSELCRTRQSRDIAVGMRGLRRKGFEATQEEQFQYIPCPKCNELMNRRNYANVSGVIIDTCRDCGVWLDNEELGRILKFIESNGLEKAQRLEQELLASKVRAASAKPKGGRGGGMLMPLEPVTGRRKDAVADGLEIVGYVLAGVVKGLFKL